mgnify:CR=1 FL=1
MSTTQPTLAPTTPDNCIAETLEPSRARGRLDPIFNPKSIAVIGATEAVGSVGRTVFWNLLSTPCGATIYPVNPKRPNVLGVKCYKSVAEIPEKVDLAVVVTQAAVVPGVIGQCADAGVGGAIVISAGFKELGPTGVELEQQILVHARRGGMRVIGPNCLGVANPITGMNATFARGIAKPGNIAFLSQSGALLTAILDFSFKEQIGFSAFVSTGTMVDVGWGDLIDYFGNDPHTRAILLYMESIGDARAFLSAAREVALSKPVIIIKAGRTDAAAKAAASHTGSLTGADEVFDAAFRRTGVLRVNSISELFSMAEVLAKQPPPKGPRLTIVTNAGGPGVLATDALIQSGGELAPLSKETFAAFNALLPPHWSRNNPVDILGDADADKYEKAIEIAAADQTSDGLLVVLTPQDMTDPADVAERLSRHARIEGKPVIASFLGGPTVEPAMTLLNEAGIPTFSYPDQAARAFTYMWKYTYNLRGIYETPSLASEDGDSDFVLLRARESAEGLLNRVRQDGRTLLDEVESKELLQSYQIPTVPTVVAGDADEAVALARRFGFPVVLKLFSRTITHKTDVGGVKLNLIDEPAVRAAFDEIRRNVGERTGSDKGFEGVTVQPMIRLKDAYELIVGASVDPQFGPVMLFGAGGQLVEVMRDRALALPPLNHTLARRMMEQTRIFQALHGVRGRQPCDLDALAHLLVNFSRLIVEQPWVAELDINPLVINSEQMLALDARVVLHPLETDPQRLPRPAIRPYPTQYVQHHALKDGTSVTIRPIRPEDEPLMIRFHEGLSERTVRLRYFHPIKYAQRVAHDRLVRVCFNDYDRELALVVERRDPGGGEREILGIGRLSKTPGRDEGEYAILITDAWQRKGLGSKLLSLIVDIARREKLRRVFAEILPDNLEMIHLSEKIGFSMKRSLTSAEVQAEILL